MGQQRFDERQIDPKAVLDQRARTPEPLLEGSKAR
jgi:hypothetical protein